MPPPRHVSDPRAARLATLWMLLFLLLQPRTAVAQHEEEPAHDERNSVDAWFGPELGLMYKVISECSRQPDLWLCLKLKALWTLERARAAPGPLAITSYLSLAPDPEAASPSGSAAPQPPDTEAQLEEQLPRDLHQRQARLDALLLQSADQLLRSRALQITLPASVFEGRGKKKDKYGGMLLVAGAAMAGMFMKVAMGKLALLAGKALIVAKMALVLSTVIGLKKLVGGGGGGGGGDHQVIYAADGHGGGGGGWGRRNLDEQGHALAYGAHQPEGPAGGVERAGRVGGGVEGSVTDDGGGDRNWDNRVR